MIVNKNSYKFLVLIILFLPIISFFSTAKVSNATPLDDISKQIQDKQKAREETLVKIKAIESNVSSITSQNSNLQKILSDLNNQKAELDKQIAIFDSQIEDQNKLLKDYATKLDQKRAEVNEKANYIYKLSFLQPNPVLSDEKSIEAYFNNSAKTNASINLFKAELVEFQKQLEIISNAKAQSQKDKDAVASTKTSLETRIAAVQNQLANNNTSIANANKNKSALTSQLNTLDGQLQFLSAQQKALLDAELAKMNANKQVNQVNIIAGQYFFMGRGRDLVEGHGLGMAQWGAYGMAQKGFTYDQILTFYYSGTTIGDYQEPAQIIVDGITGPISFQDYLAGIGEVPNNWPTEAVKAQVVAARTYAMRVCGNQNPCHICGTASCQVYIGGQGKKPFVEATKGKVILYQGRPIVAYFSASHRGYSSSLRNVWGGSDLPYIKPVQDDKWAYKDYQTTNPYYSSSCTGSTCPTKMIKPYSWQWRTNGYDLNELSTIFSRSSRTNVGTLKSITVTRDISGRVGKITLIGSTGTKSLTGWDFRTIFNANTPFNDYLYSTDFNFFQK